MADQPPATFATTFSSSTVSSSMLSIASPPSPPRRKVHAGTTPHKRKSAKGVGSISLSGGGADDKENVRLAGNRNVHQNHSNDSSGCDQKQELPAKSPPVVDAPAAPDHHHYNDDRDADAHGSDRSLSMVLSPDGSQQQQQQQQHEEEASLTPSAHGGGTRLVLDDLHLDGLDLDDLDLSGVSSITGGSDGASYGHGGRTPGPAAGECSGRVGTGSSAGGGRTSLATSSGKKTKNSNNNATNTSSSSARGRLSLSSAKSSGTGGSASSVLVGMHFLSPSTAATGTTTRTPGGGAGSSGAKGKGGGGSTSRSSGGRRSARPSLGGRPSLGSLSASTTASGFSASAGAGGAITPIPSAKGSGSATNATNNNKSSSGRRKSTAGGSSARSRRRQSRSSTSLPSTPGFASPPRLSRPNFLLSPQPAASATGAGIGAGAGAGAGAGINTNTNTNTNTGGSAAKTPQRGAGGTGGNAVASGGRAESVLRMQKVVVESCTGADANTSIGDACADEMKIGQQPGVADEQVDNTNPCANATSTTQEEDVCAEEEDFNIIQDAVDNDEVSSFDEDMFLPNASSSVGAGPSAYGEEEDDDEAMEDTATCSEDKSNVANDYVGASSPSVGSTMRTEQVGASDLVHDVPTIPEGVEDANSSNDNDGEANKSSDDGDCKEIAIGADDRQVTAPVDNDGGADDMPLPDDSADDDYDPHEDDTQSSPSRPTVLDHADIDPTPSRPPATPTDAQPAVQNVLAELPSETDLLAAALQRSATKTPRDMSKKKGTSPSRVAATPAPGLPFGEVRVGEAPIFSPLSFHGGTMVTTAVSAGSVSSPSTTGESTESSGRYFVASGGLGAAHGDNNGNRASTGIGKIRKARPSVGGVSRAGRTSIGGAGRGRGAAAASAADGIGILGMLGTAPASTNEPLVEEENEDDTSSSGSDDGSVDTSAKDESAPMVQEEGPREETTSIVDDSSPSLDDELKATVAKEGEAEAEESTMKSTSEPNVEEGCDESMAKSNILPSPECSGAANDDDVLEASFAQSSAESAEQNNDFDAKDEGNTSTSDSDSSDGSSEGSGDETESEVSSSCSSSSSDDVSIVLPNRKNKQGGRGGRRKIQASDEESDTSYHVGSSSDDAKDDDEEDVLVYDDDKGDDGSYTIESDEEEEEDDDVLIYESDESSVKAKPKKRGPGAKSKARAVIVESEDESDDSIEDDGDDEDKSIAEVEKSVAAVSIGASQSVQDDGTVIEAEVVDDDDDSVDDDVNSAPSQETLLRATDELFVAVVDKDTITVRDIFRSLEERFGMTLDKPTKKIIKGRLVALINEEARPIIVGDAATLSSSAVDQRGATPVSTSSQEGSATDTSRSLVGSRKNSVSRGKWSRGAQLGVGSFGVVHMGLNQRNGEMMAVKTLNLPDDDDLLADIEREVHLMRTLAHPNIVRYIGCERDRTHSTLSIFQEWVPGGSVSSLLRKFGPFPLPVIRKYLYQICTGLAYLHDNDIIHRDIKGSNILVTEEGVCKLADFGNSRRLGSDMKESLSMRGTPYFMAPEAFERQGGMKSDIWSLGGVAVQMCSGIPPWKKSGVQNLHELISLVKESDGPPSLPKNTDTMLHDLIRLCFQRDPSQRPNAKDLLLHPFFLDADESSTVISGDSSFGLKSPSTNRNRNNMNWKFGDGEFHNLPTEYDKTHWPDWANNKEEKKEDNPKSNPFARQR